MRDPKRIKKYCDVLAKCWEKVPDWRFGQFLSNVIGEVMQEMNCQDLFFPEDEEFFTALEKVMCEYDN